MHKSRKRSRNKTNGRHLRKPIPGGNGQRRSFAMNFSGYIPSNWVCHEGTRMLFESLVRRTTRPVHPRPRRGPRSLASIDLKRRPTAPGWRTRTPRIDRRCELRGVRGRVHADQQRPRRRLGRDVERGPVVQVQESGDLRIQGEGRERGQGGVRPPLDLEVGFSRDSG